MSDRDEYEIDPPVGDEFDELLAAMQTYHDPERMEGHDISCPYATRIPELIYAVRGVRRQRDQLLELKQEYEQELVDLRRREYEASLRRDATSCVSTMHGKLMDAHSELFALHDAVFDHNIASLGNRPAKEMRAADQRLHERTKELIERRTGNRDGTEDRQQWRAEGLATAASIVLHELDNDGVQIHTRDLLAAAVAAYEAGKPKE